MPDDKPSDKRPPFFKYAALNVYNALALVGVGVAAAVTGEWWLLAAGAAVEGLWLTFAPGSRLMRTLVWDKRWSAEKKALKDQSRKEQMKILGPGTWKRCQGLAQRRIEIERLCTENPSFTQELMADELGKLGRLVDDFVDMAITSAQFERYLGGVDFNDLEYQVRRFRDQIEKTRDPDDRQLAQRNLEVVLQRQERLTEIRSFVRKARGQLDLMENTFKLLADQIIGMRSPQEMSGRLDELIDGVEAVRTTARETEGLMQGLTR